jgi:hypothetical protein
MGLSLFKNCSSTTDYAPAPNPDPKRWTLITYWRYPRAYVLMVRYLDCTNFEGRKVMVFKGKYEYPQGDLDPHFREDDPNSPIARFPPSLYGIELAKELARKL